ncbi:hypothetical protein ATH50_2701 [Haloplanus aerogenes]|uniref:Uncharacterized protein n=1 Tax=Haloplanus aerogenes TaxID=660522 RepID=A0A3M0CVY1_9EURY|nr:hypothetical protein ATH50_2701 [Haloplanus aerogenes]
MFDHPSQRQSYRSRPHRSSAAVSLLLAASVPAVIWAVSNPLPTALVIAAVTVVVRGVRALRARAAARSTASSPPVATGRTDGP